MKGPGNKSELLIHWKADWEKEQEVGAPSIAGESPAYLKVLLCCVEKRIYPKLAGSSFPCNKKLLIYVPFPSKLMAGEATVRGVPQQLYTPRVAQQHFFFFLEAEPRIMSNDTTQCCAPWSGFSIFTSQPTDSTWLDREVCQTPFAKRHTAVISKKCLCPNNKSRNWNAELVQVLMILKSLRISAQTMSAWNKGLG